MEDAGLFENVFGGGSSCPMESLEENYTFGHLDSGPPAKKSNNQQISTEYKSNVHMYYFFIFLQK